MFGSSSGMNLKLHQLVEILETSFLIGKYNISIGTSRKKQHGTLKWTPFKERFLLDTINLRFYTVISFGVCKYRCTPISVG